MPTTKERPCTSLYAVERKRKEQINMALNIGDKVKIVKIWDSLVGSTGTVYKIEVDSALPYLVRLDKKNANGHIGDGTLPRGFGWWVREDDVEVIERAAQSGTEEDKMSSKANGRFEKWERVEVDVSGLGFTCDTASGLVESDYGASEYVVHVSGKDGSMIKCIMPDYRLRHIVEKREFKVVIESKDDTTTAKLLHGKEVVRRTSVKRYREDIYSEEAAAKAVVAKLFTPEGEV